MRFWYRTVVAATALLTGCDSSAERVAIVAHYVPACAPEAGNAPPQLELVALGDFDRSNDSVSILSSDATQQALALPQDTQGVELSSLGDRSYWGTGERNTHNQISVLLWPRDQACPLAQRSAAPGIEWLFAPVARGSQLVGLPAAPAPDATPAPAFAIDLGSAQLTELGQGLSSPRLHASASELGGRLLIAGGSDGSGHARADAEFIDATPGSPSPEPLSLAIPRSRHAALSLPSGATLLIGGESEGGAALASVEVLSPDTSRGARALELLSTPRIQPTALLLGDGRILVGGGFVWVASARDPRAGRQAIGSVEFLSFDLTDPATEPVRLDPALDRAFVELAPGSTLAVGGCDPIVRSGECLPCGATPGCISRSVWWIDPQGSEHPLEALPVALASAQPQLVAGAEGAPWLIAAGRLARFDPWQARFVPVEGLASDPPDALLQAPLGLGPGLFVWAQQRGETLDVFGLHTSQRGRLTQDIAPLLVGSGRGVVPHRPPTEALPEDEGVLRYTVARGLELEGSSSAVSIADTDYADFTLDLSLAAGPAPLLRLVGSGAAAGQASSFGGLECAWPDFTPPAPDQPTSAVRLRVQRSADAVSLLWADARTEASQPAPEPCRRPLPARVGIQLLGTPLGSTRLTRIEVRRSLDAE